jgi:hypothetical protein
MKDRGLKPEETWQKHSRTRELSLGANLVMKESFFSASLANPVAFRPASATYHSSEIASLDIIYHK